ncbi:MAG TPA: nucleoside kinase [Clostridia bacterium]|jgi:uridine kinase|nr:nucleoside kinase [Clostridia bacterium]
MQPGKQKVINLKIMNQKVEVEPHTSLLDLAAKWEKKGQGPFLAAKYNGELVDLYQEITKGGWVEFIGPQAPEWIRIYRQSLVFLLAQAVNDLFPQRKLKVQHSLGKSYYCEFKGMDYISPLDLMALEAKMREFVEAEEPIIPQDLSRETALKILSTQGHLEKVTLLENLNWSPIRIYTSGSYSNYSYRLLAPDTGKLKIFKLETYAKGFLLRFPVPTNLAEVAPNPNLPKLGQVFRESEEWVRILGVENLAGLYKRCKGKKAKYNQLIHIAEALHEKKIARIADEIYSRHDELRLVLVAGPSSSGKTTFAQRLAIQLRVLGLRPISVSLDDYFVNREETPIDEWGETDFEALEAIDLKLFNEHLQSLISGQVIEIPVFNFKTGQREWRGRKIQLQAGQPLIIEGIHGLNEGLTSSVERKNKYKIYISALTQIAIDDHNRVQTTDTRLIRRIVRDYRFRGQSALGTLKLWPSVRRGEEKNIFPFQEEADIMFNSALLYELCVLKKYAQKLLSEVSKEEKEYSDAQRLLSLLAYFPEITAENVPLNSILREFIGGSSLLGG